MNFPDVWLGRVDKKLKNTDEAPFLDGISEIPSGIIMVGEGEDGEKCLIHIPTTDFEPGVLINNTAYPIALEEYDDDSATVALDKYQTKVTTVSDDAVLGATYDKIDAVTGSHVSAINSNKFAKAIHAIAPENDDDLTPVIGTSGAVETGTVRCTLLKKDIIALKKAFDLAQVPAKGRRLVLCPDHIADLLNQDQVFANQYYNYTTGKIANLYGFEVYEYVAMPYFDGGTGIKKSFGAIPSSNDFMASVAFYAPNIGKKTGITKQYYAKAENDPENQTNRLNYRHYFIAVPKRKAYIGAIYSATIS
ncbi:hypothetical protein LJC16_00750 [Bacteroidales bacterium OttesenSCG-928-C19]|nr:hypothetical protein [Bacteroidales bacterium OttesenSCG-928-C19]